MVMGRPRKPTKLKLLKGTLRPCRENPDEPKPKSNKIKIPKGITPEAKKEWRSVCKQLKEAGIITNLDTIELGLYCQAAANWKEANDKLRLTSMVIKSPSGYPIINPYYTISKNSAEQMHKSLTEFGMTPASRSRVSATKPEEPGGKSYETL